MDAGAGAPWVDACQVPVRLSGDEEWTFLSVPVVVHPHGGPTAARQYRWDEEGDDEADHGLLRGLN